MFILKSTATVTQSNWPSLASLGQFFYILLVVAFVALLAYYSTKLLAASRSGRKSGGRRNLEVLEGIGLGAQAVAQIVRAGEKYFLIGVTKERVTILAELDEAQIRLPEPAKFNLDNSFDQILKRFIHKEKSDAGNAGNGAQDE